uniref:Uncharacterized protein n=1 Tax=Ascaris lumbricoides TaxID=6252 RepID=A0A0M3IUW9_ASCLU
MVYLSHCGCLDPQIALYDLFESRDLNFWLELEITFSEEGASCTVAI